MLGDLPFWQTVVVPLMVAVGVGLIVTTNWSVAAGHAPAGSSVVKVNVTVPAEMSAGLGL